MGARSSGSKPSVYELLGLMDELGGNLTVERAMALAGGDSGLIRKALADCEDQLAPVEHRISKGPVVARHDDPYQQERLTRYIAIFRKALAALVDRMAERPEQPPIPHYSADELASLLGLTEAQAVVLRILVIKSTWPTGFVVTRPTSD